MRFIDLNDTRIDLEKDTNEITLHDLLESYRALKSSDPENYPDTFSLDLLNVLMATVNGRNDLQIIGLTARETDRIITKLQRQL